MRPHDIDHEDLQPGMRLDRYELFCIVARGGMGSVWLGRLLGKHGFEKLVAIKTILPYYAAEPQFRSMFLDEARIASGIVHPNVAQTIDLGEQDGVLYTVIEWMEGDSLRSLQRKLDSKGLKIPLGIALRVASDACAGLHAAHEHLGADGTPLGVVHRDVSPHNILITSGGVSKLIDFGIAKARGRIAGETSPGDIKGKVEYMAPEQASGGEVDRRSDVWGLGATLYHVVAGVPPFGGENQLISLRKLLSGNPPRALDMSIPAPVRAVISRAMAQDPGARFATAADMGRALDDAMRQARLAPSHADVAGFLAEHMADAAKKRRAAMERALKDSDQRKATAASASPVKPISSDPPSLPRTDIVASASADSVASSLPSAAPSRTGHRRRAVFALAVAGVLAIVVSGVIGFRFSKASRATESAPLPGSVIASAASDAVPQTSALPVPPAHSESGSFSHDSGLPEAGTRGASPPGPAASRPPRPVPDAKRPSTPKGPDQDVDDGF